jgi:tetratricopeptide (TPR) repeat protein
MPIRNLVCSVALIFAASAAHALGMSGQPSPGPAALRDAVRFSQEIIAPTGDKGRARPQLLVLIETNPTTDLVERFAPGLRDANTYTAVLSTYDDALIGETDPRKKTFIRYNMLKTIVARATFLPTTARRSLLARATELAETLAKENRSDAAVWEVTGDLYALKDDISNAVAAYRRMGAAPGLSAMASYKTAQAYQRVRNWDSARTAYEAGIRADSALGATAGGRETRHLLYQGLASLYLAEGRNSNAAEALLLSAKVKADADAPYPLRLDVAETLLKRGLAKPVREYAVAVLKITPDDEGAKRLLVAADAATP